VIELAGALLDLVQIAHDTQLPHEEPGERGGGASAVLVIAIVAGSLAVVAALVWLKKRVDG
jgi:hypothetical protein